MYKIKVLDKRGKVVARPTQTFTSFDAIEDFMDEKYPKHIYVSDFAKGNPAKHHYEVLVGDTSVYRSTYHETSVGKRQAVSIYNDAVKKSKEGTGWQSGQDVLLLQDEKPVRKFVGYYGNPTKRKRNRGSSMTKTFKSLPVGAQFEFESIRTFPHSGMMRGPWIKTSARGYRLVDDNGIKYKVGSTNAKVDVLSQSNPPKGKFIPCKAIRFNRDGSVSMKR